MTLFDSGNLEPRELLPGDGSMVYHCGFYSLIDSGALMDELLREVPWEARPITVFGRTVMQPRLACWYGDVSYSYSGITLEPRSWSPRLAEVKAKVEEFTTDFRTFGFQPHYDAMHHIADVNERTRIAALINN